MAAGQPIPEAVIEVVEPSGARRNLEVDQSPFLIGRGAESGNHLQLSDRRISRQCAAIVYDDGAFHLRNRGQRHGLFVNGKNVDSCALQESDVITFGMAESIEIVFHTSGPRETMPQLLSRLEQAASLQPGARDLRQLSLLLEATALLQSHRPLEEVLGAMVDRALEITDADRGLLLEADPEDGVRPLLARERGGRELPVGKLEASRTAIARATETRRSVVEEDIAQATTALRDAQSIVAQQLRSVVAVPLYELAPLRSTEVTYKTDVGQLLGVLYLDSRRPAAFSRLERQILDALSLEAASILDNARLVKREQERQRMERELDVARTIQQGLLPKGFRDFAGFQITGVNQPCQAVGGDYFDLIELSSERIGFVVADVSGKGLGAALLTAMLQGNFSGMAMGQEPASVFAHINRFICSRSEVERYATLFFGLLDASGRLEYLNAGHHSPLLIRDGNVKEPFPAESLPLGLLPETEFKASASRLLPGDTLVMFTDGINEAMNLNQEEFGVDRLKAVVAKHAGDPVEVMQTAVLEAVQQFTKGNPQADDITFFVIRYAGTAGTQN